jgi:hypothetical protein
MSNFDPNFPNRDPRFDPADWANNPTSRSWTLGVGVAIVVLIVGFLALGRNHTGDSAALNAPTMAPATSPTITSPPANATLPAIRNPAETTGSAPRAQ